MAYCITDFWSRGTFCTRFYLSWVDYSGGDNLSAYFNEPKWNYCVSGHQRRLTDTLWTMATRHWVYQLCPAFPLREAVPGLPVTHICAELDFHSWPGRDPLPSLFFLFSPSAQGLGKKVSDWIIFHCHCWRLHLDSPPRSPAPFLSASVHKRTDQALGAQ